MARSVNVAMILIVLFLSSLSATPIASEAEEISTQENMACFKELKELLNTIFDKVIAQSEDPFDLPKQMDPKTSTNRLRTRHSSSSESSSESFEHNSDNIAQQLKVILEKLELMMQSVNRTISSSPFLRHYQHQAASLVTKLQEQSFVSCETSPLFCFVFRLLHWMYVEPTYELLRVLRHWINTTSINSGAI